ncbi:GxxExxY protein [Labilibaculum antarcticum]|uniref:Uncharacterized protein n=1 Tax=Labilibaculum antarcticum TaxID=1717717 RepID=A0A1Y1CKL4_9BACT|nr:GxxExxY protein [Labilibaculum antarcticum]BAX80844.1 hypothetical protein ALGA_2522 [Labilibaculum antarcticum]
MPNTLQNQLKQAIQNTIKNPNSQELQNFILDLSSSNQKKEIAKEIYPIAVNLPDISISLYTKAILADLIGKSENSSQFLLKYIIGEFETRDIGNAFQLWEGLIVPSFTKKTSDKCLNDLTNHFKKHLPLTEPNYQTCLGIKQFQKDSLKALMHFKQATVCNPQHWFGYYYMSLIYVFELKNYHAAIKMLQKCFKIESFNNQIGCAKVSSLLGICYGEIGEVNKAIELFNLSIKAYAEDGIVYLQKGFYQLKVKKYSEAIKSFDKCIQIGPDSDSPYLNKINALKKLKRYNGAIEVVTLLEDAKGMTTKHLKRIKLQLIQLKQNIKTILPDEDYSLEFQLDVNTLHPKKTNKKNGQNGIIYQESVLENLLCIKLQKEGILFDQEYEIFENDEYYGKQLAMSKVGILDLLLKEKNTNDLVVLELKKDSGYNTNVVEQTLGYMSWIKQNLAVPKQKVKGLICLYKATPQLLQEASKHDIEVQEYEFHFHKAN